MVAHLVRHLADNNVLGLISRNGSSVVPRPFVLGRGHGRILKNSQAEIYVAPLMILDIDCFVFYKIR